MTANYAVIVRWSVEFELRLIPTCCDYGGEGHRHFSSAGLGLYSGQPAAMFGTWGSWWNHLSIGLTYVHILSGINQLNNLVTELVC